MAEIAQLTVGVDKIAERRSPGCNRFGQHRFDCVDQPGNPRAGHIAAQPQRRYPSHIERFAHVDVAKTCDDSLIQQQLFDRRGPPGKVIIRVPALD